MQAGRLDMSSAMKQLFGKTYGKQMVICIALHVGSQFCGINAINYYSSQIFRCVCVCVNACVPWHWVWRTARARARRLREINGCAF